MSTSMTKEIQEKELSMLLYFKEFCDKHNLRFYLCASLGLYVIMALSLGMTTWIYLCHVQITKS